VCAPGLAGKPVLILAPPVSAAIRSSVGAHLPARCACVCSASPNATAAARRENSCLSRCEIV